MARKAIDERIDGLKLTCDYCCATASTPALILPSAREYVAGKWGWIVSPSDHDLCHVCAKRGEHLHKPYSTLKIVANPYAIPEGVFPKPKPKKRSK